MSAELRPAALEHAACAALTFVPSPVQVWEDGQAFKDLQQRLAATAEQRDAIEAARKVGGVGPSRTVSCWRVCALMGAGEH